MADFRAGPGKVQNEPGAPFSNVKKGSKTDTGASRGHVKQLKRVPTVKSQIIRAPKKKKIRRNGLRFME